MLSSLQVQKTLVTQTYSSVSKGGSFGQPHHYPSVAEQVQPFKIRPSVCSRVVTSDTQQPLKPSLKKKPGGPQALKSPFQKMKRSVAKSSILTTEAAENQESCESETQRKKHVPRVSGVPERTVRFQVG